jgi:hypothetical protein
MRHRPHGLCALAVYFTAAVVCPALHLSHHAAAGADHTHGIAAHEAPVAAALDLAALGLADVSAPAVVDCALADLTLADCDTPSDGPRHFGDDTGRDAPPPPAPIDVRHGAGSLEHLGAWILASSPITLPPPLLRETRLAVFARPPLRSLELALPHHSRGPPSLVV